MNIQVPFKPKIVLTLLSVAAAMDGLSLLWFTRIDAIVHSDLYNYGLQFSHEWALEYWTLSDWLITSLTLATIFFGVSITSLIMYMRTHADIWRLICYLFMIFGTVSTLFSGYVFTNLDNSIHHDLYRYGLRFSYDWATNYWTYARLTLGSIGLATAINLFSATLVLLSTRRQIRIDPRKLTYSTLTAIGASALVLSVVYTSSILAFIGLGLIFWGIILTYIRAEEYVKGNLLESTALSTLEILDQVLKELDCKAKAVYLPPKYLTTPEANKAYISIQEEEELPTPEYTQRQETELFLENPKGILLTPPGAELSKLFEKTLETSFTRVNLQYLQQNMPKIFIEDLEIAQNLEMQMENSKIHVKIENSAYKNLTQKTEKLSHVYSLLGDPVSSAIACALAKATGKPITIENQKTKEDGKSIEIEYRIKEEEEQPEQ